MELVALLTEQGYGSLAGELLTEISLGREIPPPSKQKSDHQLEESDEETVRIEIPEKEQLSFACDFLALRLVEPVRRLAEAERTAATLLARGGDRPDAISIGFLRAGDDLRPALTRNEGAGRAETADALEIVLTQLRAIAN